MKKRVFTLAAVAAFWFLPFASDATPLQECAATGVTMPCLDAKLKEANQRLNATLKAAQERLEQLQANGRRPVMGAFVDSQRKFNAYRDAQCAWQGVRAAPGENSAEYVKDCQIRATVAREQELAAFAKGEDAAAPAEVAPSPAETAAPEPIQVAPSPPAAEPPTAEPVAPQAAIPPAVASQESAGATRRGVEWRLVSWVVNGKERLLVADSTVTIAFDPTGKVAGNASINRFSGSYRFDADGRLQWPQSSFTLTRMAGPPPLIAQERAFLESLRRTVNYRADGQQLVLQNHSGSTVLTFQR